jgi:gluconate 5-dehydrogenase
MSYLEQLFSLSGRVAIVAGGSRGIGAAIAEALASAGASVISIGRTAVDAVEPRPGVTYYSCDVTNAADFIKIVALTEERCGPLSILINSAAGTWPAADGLQSPKIFQETLSLNLSAAYAICVAASASMIRAGRGSIVNITSINSVLGFPGNPGYVAAKGGLRMLTRALAVDLAKNHIRVNNIAPGYIRTEMTAASYANPEARDARTRQTILGRWGEPEDLVGAAIFLASDASAYVTGQDLFVDGGWTAKGLI